MSLSLSVVIATRNRGGSVVCLAEQLGRQTLDPSTYEVIVVDDGSPEPVAPLLQGLAVPMPLRVIRIDWSGQGTARHRGARLATGDILVFLDDDMQVAPDFLAAHRAQHTGLAPTVVFGRIDPAPGLADMPLFERYHARQLDRWRQEVADGRVRPRGAHLCTGNVSMRRRDYFDVGGFNLALERSEDRELGIRLEQHGCTFVASDDAVAVHWSDHASLSVWLRRAGLYGRIDRRLAAMHPSIDNAHPWSFWRLIHPLSRPVVALALLSPALGHALALAFYGLARVFDVAGAGRPAVLLTALTYALEYYAGYRRECGTFAELRADIRRVTGRKTLGEEWRTFTAAVRADHDMMRAHRHKYQGEVISPKRLPIDLVQKAGFQMLAWYRLMRFAYACRVPLVPMVISRLIRHLYGAEIHWRARLAPGISIVHGVGLVISHAAEVSEGCILFQNVTLGENRDSRTGRVGAPRLGRYVHVGPGATLLGPIDIGDRSKVAAGVTLMRSVLRGSLVAPPEPVITHRRASFGADALAQAAGL